MSGVARVPVGKRLLAALHKDVVEMLLSNAHADVLVIQELQSIRREILLGSGASMTKLYHIQMRKQRSFHVPGADYFIMLGEDVLNDSCAKFI